MLDAVSAHDVVLQWRDGSAKTLMVDDGETVVDAADRVDIALPYGCLYGACGTCTGRLAEGRVDHTTEPRALKPKHREARFVFLCVAVPRANCRIEGGARV